jgi:signal transduction histidine kinase
MMRRVRNSQAFRELNAGVRWVVLLFLVAFSSLNAVQAKSSVTITNLAQMIPALAHENPLTADLEIDATVFTCDTNTGVLILQDATDTELLEVDGLSDSFHPGDVIHMEGKGCMLAPGDFGIFVTFPPFLDDDGIHSPITVRREHYFTAGRHPLRLDYFNQHQGSLLEVNSSFSGTETNLQKTETSGTNFLKAVRASCFQGSWARLPNFRLIDPVKTGSVTNFSLGFLTREEMVGIRFEGYFEAPRSGKYRFELSSDDGSRLWIDPSPVTLKKIGIAEAPRPRSVKIAQPMNGLNDHSLVTIEGRPSFLSRFGKGLKIELRSGQNSVSVILINCGTLESKDLLNASVRVSGIATCISGDDQTIRMGTVTLVNPNDLTLLEHPFYHGTNGEALTTVMQVHSLTRDEAASKVSVRIGGTVTAAAPFIDRWMILQDDTRGIFVNLTNVPNCRPRIGEYWNISGFTQPGDFSPVIIAQQAVLSGTSKLPEPAHPSWSQLANGSMDVQRVELQGLVTGVHSNELSLVTAEGHLEVAMANWAESELKSFVHAIVSIRGTLFATWNAETHEVHVADITMFNTSVMVETPAPTDPFDAPEKSVRGLLRFDPQATPFQRLKVRGRVTYAESKRVFLERGAGIEVLPSTNMDLKIGDDVEAVGYLELYGATTRLREALLHTTGHSALAPAPRVPDSELSKESFAAERICLEGKLAGFHTEEDSVVLQVQMPTHLILARVSDGGSLRTLRPGSKLSLSGVRVPNADSANSNNDSRIELLVSGPDAVIVLSKPSWWTLQRLLSAVAVLLVTLSLAGVWIALLRKQVAHRTLLLQHEIRERERVEREHALETERSRIARDLHDDLGSRLTEINFLASTSQLPSSPDETHTTFKAISERARALVKALDVIVWAVDPEDNSLQSLADYLCSYTREYLTNSAIPCRFKVPIACPELSVDGKVRHEVFMAVKEILNNIVRHADASEVTLKMTIGDVLEINIIDNGKGFDSTTSADGHGLKNCSLRLAKIGGSFQIESDAGTGATFRIEIPLECLAVFQTEEQKTVTSQTMN